MRKLLLILMLIPFFAAGQLYYTKPTTTTTSAAWTPPAAWVDSLGAIDVTDGGNIAANTIKILVDTRVELRTYAFAVTCVGGYKVKWGKGETAINYNSASTAERTYDTTKCQRYCVIEITPQGANGITAFAVKLPTTVKRANYPSYLWIASNYTGASPAMAVNNITSKSLQSVYFVNSTSLGDLSSSYKLQSITIPSTVISIGGVFYNNLMLQSITIPSSVTSLGGSIFSGAYSLKTITIPSSVTSIGTYALSNCYGLENIIINCTTGIIPANFMTDCWSLANITLTSGITSIGDNAFANNYSLKSITIPSTVTSIGSNIFSQNFIMSSVTWTGASTSAQDHGANTFKYCEQLLTLDMAGLKTTRFSIYGSSGSLNKLGSGGNISGYDAPLKIDWANSTFASTTAPQLNLSYNEMTQAQLAAILAHLPTVGAAGSNTKQVTVVGCTGASSLSAAEKQVATDKGWQVLN